VKPEGAGLPRAMLDRRLVERAVHNLMQNAMNYTPAGGTITLAARCFPGGQDCEFIEVSVSDTGPGVPLEDRGRVFDKYYRVPGNAAKGSGLGLSVVKSVAEAHGGRVARWRERL